MATRIPRVLGLTTVALAFAVTPPAQAATPVHYTVTFIGAKSDPVRARPGQAAVAWRGGAVVPLGSLPGSTWSEAHAMNQAGVAVGAAGFNGDEFAPHHPVLFAHGQVTDLWPDLGGSTSGTAFAVNATGTVVGDGRDGWVYRDGVRTDLDRLIPADAGVTITAAWAINDAGQIAATAHLKNGTTTQRTPDYAVLLTPVTG